MNHMLQRVNLILSVLSLDKILSICNTCENNCIQQFSFINISYFFTLDNGLVSYNRCFWFDNLYTLVKYFLNNTLLNIPYKYMKFLNKKIYRTVQSLQ